MSGAAVSLPGAAVSLPGAAADPVRRFAVPPGLTTDPSRAMAALPRRLVTEPPDAAATLPDLITGPPSAMAALSDTIAEPLSADVASPGRLVARPLELLGATPAAGSLLGAARSTLLTGSASLAVTLIGREPAASGQHLRVPLIPRPPAGGGAGSGGGGGVSDRIVLTARPLLGALPFLGVLPLLAAMEDVIAPAARRSRRVTALRLAVPTT
ncbi:hypothetical protein [[Actinomadura] parvosata]|uniref:hypothetical protein n=1 Tax=[Actinomadura] parvosata TaxID=1955412 RepID=UPI0012BCBED3|nr:hypothetical protein [Nonomuraea sp. ATCC 55076]